MKKFCVKCGKQFDAMGREVICPACKQTAAEESKKAAVLKAKAKSWTGESVPVRISGRASTVIRKYGAANNLPFAAALDDLLKASAFFQSAGKTWEDITPYRSRRRDKAAADKQASDFLHGKHATEDASTTENKQEAQEEVKTAAKVASKATTSKATSKVQTAGKPQEVKQDKPMKPVKQVAKKAVKTSTSKK